MHKALLKGMEIDPEHRCVLHVGGGYNDKEKALEMFINNWSYISPAIQKMIMLENVIRLLQLKKLYTFVKN